MEMAPIYFIIYVADNVIQTVFQSILTNVNDVMNDINDIMKEINNKVSQDSSIVWMKMENAMFYLMIDTVINVEQLCQKLENQLVKLVLCKWNIIDLSFPQEGTLLISVDKYNTYQTRVCE